MQYSPALQAALAYAAIGFSVLPLRPSDLPLILVPVSELVSGRGCVPPSRRVGA